MSGKRVFIALDISEDARDVCSEHINHLRREFSEARVGWERPEKLHLTVKFLGNTDHSSLEKLRSTLRQVAGRYRPIGLKLSHTGVFPSKQRPRILWVGLQGESETLTALHGDIEAACSRLGFDEDGRTFRPHVTIGRIREPMPALQLCEEHLRRRIEQVEFEVGEVVVYESKLQRTGSVYLPIWRIGLGDGMS